MSNREENCQVKMERIYVYETAAGGLVNIYKVTSSSLLNEFFLVSFDDGYAEEAWAVGPTPEVALKSAAQMWGAESNPFKEALAHFE